MNQEIPNFQEGAILRAKTLQTMCDFSYLLPQFLRKDYADGIVSGMELSEQNGELFVDSGVFSMNRKLFYIENQWSVPCFPTEEEVRLKLCLNQEKQIKNATEYEFSLEINETECTENEFELCRFRLQEGAKLRSKYVDFQDISTEYDTINLQYAHFSGYLAKTIHPKVLLHFATELSSYPNISDLDANFCLQIFQSNTGLNFSVITHYLRVKTGEFHQNLTQNEAYETLLSILQQSKQGETVTKTKKSVSRASILID